VCENVDNTGVHMSSRVKLVDQEARDNKIVVIRSSVTELLKRC